MTYKIKQIQNAEIILKKKLENESVKSSVLRAPELRDLYKQIVLLPIDQRAEFGEEVNKLKQEIQSIIEQGSSINKELDAIDISAPWDINTPLDKKPRTLDSKLGSLHPLTNELNKVLEIFYLMGFSAIESRQIDDDYHMFESLNFPTDHPARDDYDTFMTPEGLIAPAHTSTMQHRVLKANKHQLEKGKNIAFVVPGRVFRNEDLDARHEHTFLQIEGIFVGKGVHAGNLIATFKAFLDEYYAQDMEVRLQPFYFPFTEPSFEFVLSCPFCQKKGCQICSRSGWIELGGSGMIHPNVLKMADIDPKIYTGFAWGFGFERLVMMKNGIEDIRHFQSGRLEFLRQFV